MRGSQGEGFEGSEAILKGVTEELRGGVLRMLASNC